MNPSFTTHWRLLGKPGVDVARRELAVLDGSDGHCVAGQLGGVPAGEHLGVAGAHLLVGYCEAALRLHGELAQDVDEFLLTDRLDHLVAVKYEVAAGDLADAAPAVRSGFGHFHADAF